jgi:hypothetical protein
MNKNRETLKHKQEQRLINIKISNLTKIEKNIL